MAANAGHGAGRGNRKAKDQGMAAAMKDGINKRGVERLTMMCPMGCGTSVRRLIEGCKSAQNDQLGLHMASCKGRGSVIRKPR